MIQGAAAAFASFVGSAGLQSQLEPWGFVLVQSATAILSVGAWGLAASQTSDAERQGKLLDDIALARQPGDLPAAVEKLHLLRNDDLRQQAGELSAEMRAFEAGMQLSQSQTIYARPPENATVAESNAFYEERTKEMISESSIAKAEFSQRFRSRAMALRAEMRARLGMSRDLTSDEQTVALDYGMLAGVNPIGQAADQLDNLARRLP